MAEKSSHYHAAAKAPGHMHVLASPGLQATPEAFLFIHCMHVLMTTVRSDPHPSLSSRQGHQYTDATIVRPSYSFGRLDSPRQHV